jgi:hypothetical protein
VSPEGFEYARRRVAENEDLVVGWRELIERMHAEGLDVTVARDLLKDFERELETRRHVIRGMMEQREP